jgi:hypothetical protein
MLEDLAIKVADVFDERFELVINRLLVQVLPGKQLANGLVEIIPQISKLLLCGVVAVNFLGHAWFTPACPDGNGNLGNRSKWQQGNDDLPKSDGLLYLGK